MARVTQLLGLTAAVFFLCSFFSLPTRAQAPPCASATYVYVNNNVDGANSVSAFCVGTGGALTAVQGSPFLTGGNGTGAGYYASNGIAATPIGNLLFASDGSTNDIAVFSIDANSGVLTAVAGSPFAYGSPDTNLAGISLAVTPNGQLLYAGDSVGNVWGFSVATSGSLTSISGSPFAVPTGFEPDGINVTRDGKYLAVAPGDNEVQVAMFSIGTGGVLTAVSGSPFAAGGDVGVTGIDTNCASSLLFAAQASFGGTMVTVDTISSGALSQISGSPFVFGTAELNSNVGVLSPNDDFLYVSNQFSNTISVLSVAASGSLLEITDSPFCNSSNTSDCMPGAENPFFPTLLSTNQAGSLLFVSNGAFPEDNTVNVFTIGSNGALTLTSGSPYDTGAEGQPSLVVFPPKACGLSAAKTADATSVNFGATAIGFTVTTTNPISALSTADSVTITDPLPSGAPWSISPAYTGPGTCAISGVVGSEILNCAVGNLTPGTAASVHIAAPSPAVGAYENTATVSATNITSPLTAIATITVNPALVEFSELTLSQTISVGTASEFLSGTLSAAGPVFPPSGETISVTIADIAQTTNTGGDGTFSLTFPTSAIAASTTPYAITYSYPGDKTFAGATNSSTALTVNAATGMSTLTLNLVGTGAGTVTGPSIDCTETNGTGQSGSCMATYATGTQVTLTAVPTAPSTFGGWTGACSSSGMSPACTLPVSSDLTVYASFVPPPVMVNLTFPTGTNSTQSATFACPANMVPCPSPNAHQLSFTVPTVSTSFGITVAATEIPPSQFPGYCEVGYTVLNDFGCRFTTFFGDGTDPSGNTIVPYCVGYANGDCVHYLVYATATGPGTEPDPSDYSGGVSWVITWNNTSAVAPPPYWSGSTPQFYDDPDSPPQPNSAVGTNCSEPMTIDGVPQTYFCQFEYNITTYYDPTEGVDPGIGGSTKAFNDVVIAYPPTSAGSGTVVSPPLATAAPTISGACVMGCTTAGGKITFAINTGGTFRVKVTGYPAPTVTESGALPAGLSFNPLTGILGGTPTAGINGDFPISFIASSSAGVVTSNYAITIGQLTFSSATIDFGDAYPDIPVLRSLTITNAGTSKVTFSSFNIEAISGDDSSGYVSVELCPDTLEAGKSCIVIMEFTADSNVKATHAADFVVKDNVHGSPQIIPMSANVINPIPSLSPLILNFGDQNVGSQSAAESVTLKNIGTTPLVLSSLGVTGEFKFATGPENLCASDTMLAPAATCLIYVTFDPTSEGPQVGLVTLTDNALISTQLVALLGNGEE